MICRGWLFIVTEFFLYITNNSIIVHSRVNQATTLTQGGWVGLLLHPVCTLVGAISVRNSRGGWAGGHNFVAGLPFPDFLRVNFFVYFFNVCRSGIFKVVIIPSLNLWKVTPIIQTAETCLLNSKKISLRCERVNIPCTIWWSFRLFRWCNLAPRSSVAKAEQDLATKLTFSHCAMDICRSLQTWDFQGNSSTQRSVAVCTFAGPNDDCEKFCIYFSAQQHCTS